MPISNLTSKISSYADYYLQGVAVAVGGKLGPLSRANSDDGCTWRVPSSVWTADPNSPEPTHVGSLAPTVTSKDGDRKSDVAGDADLSTNITIVRGPSKGCLMFYNSKWAWYIERYPTREGDKVKTFKGFHLGYPIPTSYTTTVFKYAKVELEEGQDTFDMKAIERAAMAKPVVLTIDHPWKEDSDPSAAEALSLDVFDAINRSLSQLAYSVRWYTYVEGAWLGGSRQRQMLAYALTTSPICD